MQVPVMFVLDAESGAFDVLYFCSERCLRIHETDQKGSTGISNDYIDGDLCDECGVKLPA
jgi:hypothetical protein